MDNLPAFIARFIIFISILNIFISRWTNSQERINLITYYTDNKISIYWINSMDFLYIWVNSILIYGVLYFAFTN